MLLWRHVERACRDAVAPVCACLLRYPWVHYPAPAHKRRHSPRCGNKQASDSASDVPSSPSRHTPRTPPMPTPDPMHPSRDETAPSSSRSAPGSVLDDFAEPPQSPFWVLLLGAVGVVYGDIGTSPLYALRESLRAAGGTTTRADVLGVCSLLLWALIVVVTAKYVLFLLRADNNGEGGILSLMALAQSRGTAPRAHRRVRPRHRRGRPLLWRFRDHTGDLGALGGRGARHRHARPRPLCDGDRDRDPDRPVRGSVAWHRVRVGAVRPGHRWSGSLVLAVGGAVPYRPATPEILCRVPSAYAAWFPAPPRLRRRSRARRGVPGRHRRRGALRRHGPLRRAPIRAAWLGLVFPALTLNYLGQGALVLADPDAPRPIRSSCSVRTGRCCRSWCSPPRPR